MPNANAIGRPSTTHTATITTKKISRFQLPSCANNGLAHHSPPTITATSTMHESASSSEARSASRASAITSSSAQPTPMAATRTPSRHSSAGVVTTH